ncbi:LLM class F420-dependent oxidoreductase [Mycolicibacter minnesotensis]|uniref:LLM class F420-dependent oxidoreductase n=1 Tax=Mycolicibacter minnesotensis TaxID=1118379 RepID=A0A7I7R9X9_9MYCO|nr:TIGR03857 family LLM class F420-dependent oxidoreductase [Mycolicibacter minnesotensis]ORB03061.1 LLM class F420-dependent oxidoreductase [Mycolicibacter minnesotensis]BBY35458.1 LLM class F420-dependent oxidoreductase [Mycolicibacter minnesotensis]
MDRTAPQVTESLSAASADYQLNELGYYAVTRHPADARVVLPEARAAEALGLGSCHIGERFTVKDPAVLSGAVAGCSQKLGIAPSTNHHTRHPTVTATVGSTMHALTEGRFAMAFGRGMGGYWQAMGLPTVTAARLRDFFGILRRLWAGEMILDHDGPAGKWPMLRHANGLGEGPPIGLVAVGPKTMELAGEIADFVVLHTFFSDRATEASVAAVRRGAERAGRDPDSVRIWACLATVCDSLSPDDQLRRGVGRLATYLQAYPDVLVSANGWDPTVWDRIRQSELFTDAATAGPIDASASFETLQRLAELIPAEWLAAAAAGSARACAGTVARQFDLGVHSVIMHGASPHELEPVVQAYRADRPTLPRAVAANPGRFA